ncbi:hypothetical protein TBLA_0E03510 [Henningerozyma blattae CBS 6284]|uniref:Uncharacterized protein n=1 Tax=Henningerozyma blattae (strain ATCC 34711 / CBS 6284 / DSM 70876 / NBRC 10599 / NRRL Y-10934 / UCD 77-7) TaxID=1071380 RepID=I2H4V3_HENB6|nr:hypothetical protein TBLA_0E03510 [Tetrapisispora blattae CBS 6284]CCH61405.1 hypothetical protein TBLA_0E03510 [Tetrapisispora blattae CBS 6284]
MPLRRIEFTPRNLSEISGSISIACWVIVFVPQIYENFYRKSSEGLSLLFIVLWLAGDVFNVVGAQMQHLLPTMVILAAYYTLADIVLLIQCLFYGNNDQDDGVVIDPVHLSPANPITDNVLEDVFHEEVPLLRHTRSRHSRHSYSGALQDDTIIIDQQLLDQNDAVQYNLNGGIANPSDNDDKIILEEAKYGFREFLIVSSVILSGFLSWYISYCHKDPNSINPPPPSTHMNYLAQLFGYVSAVLYLGSRVPQILLNFERKSCEGISFLFFLFAFLGNSTFIFSVLIISRSKQYLILNASWLIGSTGTLLMDGVIFIQFFYYNSKKIKLTDENTTSNV